MKSMLNLLRRIPASPIKKASGCMALIGGGAAAAAIAYSTPPFKQIQKTYFAPLLAQCATKTNPQSSVINDTKKHALFLTIHLNPSANAHECLKSLGKLQQYVDKISPPDLRDETDEIWFGVGFGPDFFAKVEQKTDVPVGQFPYRTRLGALGALPHTGGDIFVHAKCDERGKLFELAQAILAGLPSQSVSRFEDIYGWVYRNGRDLSGFIDGTENPADVDERIKVAIDPKTGGSYAVTQRWVHNHSVIQNTRDDIKSQWIGRTLEDSIELKKKSASSHVARMVGSTELDAEAKYQIVRHSQPYGTLAGESGLFFLAYSATPVALDWMLDRMTGKTEDKLCR
ncbi:putative deferrochelatase/peroxidase YfeX [Fasciola gigantica]|uniref:Putative deferrochelatase/peroxidase YfeX n=1 Tax=Fasciola gigantica TaxID=46835 RepID=A0A504YEG5_FASGI|nr:putative deferrochelatase/peroxidase YfeX [Fasciola gigantica]